jgi:hypothetical protein
LKKLRNEPVYEDTYSKWKEHYQTIENAIEKNRVPPINIKPGLAAGIGLRDFFDSLTEEEKEWCVAHIMNILQYELFDAGRHDFGHVQHSSFEKEAALYVLPKLMHHASDKEELRRYIFAFLIRSEDKFEKKHLISSIHSFLWHADPKFMMACIRAMLLYSEIAQARSFQGITVYKPGSPKNLKEFTSMIKSKSQLSWKNLIRMLKGEVKEKTLGERITEAEITYNSIVKNIGEGNLNLNLDGFNFDGKSAHYLFEVLRIIPRDTEIVELRKYYFDLLKYVLDNIDRNGERWEPNERFHHELLRIFKKRLTAYILHQPDEVALDIFKLLTDWAYDPNFKTRRRDKIYEFVNECLEEIIRMVIMEETKSEKFWKLWEYLIQRDLELNKAPFAKKVLLNDVMFSSTLRAWQPLAGKNRLYEKYICSGYGVESAVRLIGGIGFYELVPDGISWLGDLVKADAYKDEDVAIYFERLIIQCYYNINLRKRLKSNANLRESFITILDFLINQYASSCAYIIREDFISLKN